MTSMEMLGISHSSDDHHENCQQVTMINGSVQTAAQRSGGPSPIVARSGSALMGTSVAVIFVAPRRSR